MDKIYRVVSDGEAFYAVEGAGGQGLRRAAPHGADIFDGYAAGDIIPGGLAGVKIVAPVRPSKMVCVGLNYKDHAAEQKKALPPEPLIFFKPPSAVLNPGEPILLPPGVGRVDYEAELAIVIGKRAHRVPRTRAFDYVFGFTCVNDITARDVQNKEPQYTRAKGFDTFAPFGPCIAVGADNAARRVEGWVNGEKRQDSTTGQLIFPIDFLVEYISFVMTLEPGDIISTGTPSGVGALNDGDVVMVRVEGVGELTNPVVGERAY
jgi:2-keto-4-pentenoate hydratase/2-oxohepta-3-ene-1,7-dioic acid hydratase in catechol pathway